MKSSSSQSKQVGCSDASSDALQNTNKKQWRDPPQKWETQDTICLYCWCRREHKTKGSRSCAHLSSRSHHCERDEFYDSLQSCSQIHSDASGINSRCKGSSGKRMGGIWRKFWHGSWQKSETMWSMKQGTRAEKFILRHWWTFVTLRIWSWNLHIKKYKGRVVLRGDDTVRDDSGAYAENTEQGSRASQMTAANVMDIVSRLPGCSGQAADAVSAKTQVRMEDTPTLLKIPKSECPDVWIRLPKHKWPKSWSSVEDPVVSLERKLYGHPLVGLLWERQFEKVLLEHRWEEVLDLELICQPNKRTNLISVCGWHQSGRNRQKT